MMMMMTATMIVMMIVMSVILVLNDYDDASDDVDIANESRSNFDNGCCCSCRGGDLGQNLFADWDSSPDYPPINYTRVTYYWANEREYWNYTKNECQPGQKCGHWKVVSSIPIIISRFVIIINIVNFIIIDQYYSLIVIIIIVIVVVGVVVVVVVINESIQRRLFR